LTLMLMSASRNTRKFLYRRFVPAVIVILAGFTLAGFILVLFGATAPPAVAQGRPQLKRPEQTPPEKPPEPAKKKVKGPRAVAILQLNSNGKGSLIPVAILVDGKFYDASVYKADPVPMALDSGTVYEVEQAGDSLGLFTVNAALHSKSQGSPNPWLGTGAYLLNGTEAAKTTRKAEDVPVGIDTASSDEPPRLTRKGASKAADAPAAPSAAPSSTPPAPAAGSADKPAAPAADSQPASGTPASKPAAQDAAKPATDSAPEKSADQGGKPQAPAKEATPAQAPTQPASVPVASAGPPASVSPAPTPSDQASSGQTAPAPASPSKESENYYRPTLRRGKPTQAAPEEDDMSPKAAKPAANPGSPATAAAPASTGPLQLLPAISDGGGPDPRSYKFFWKTGEEDDRRTQMLALATDAVRAYTTALAKNRIPAKPPAAKPASASHKGPAKPVQPVFENIQFHAFDVWLNYQPVIVLSAEARFPPQPEDTVAPETYSVTFVARTDIYGNLRKLYSGVTDKFHLDITPRLELIDAVDADGDGRGELLFRETTDAGSGYIVYRATGDTLWKMFDSLAEKR
jgi:hypothetical protein